jgi:hypothetical protein
LLEERVVLRLSKLIIGLLICIAVQSSIPIVDAVLCPHPSVCPCILAVSSVTSDVNDPRTITLELSASYTNLNYIDYGDGVTLDSLSLTHTYQNPGTYTITLKSDCQYGCYEKVYNDDGSWYCILGTEYREVQQVVTIPGSDYTITASAGAGGSISPDGKVTVSQGNDQVFTISPDGGYAIQDVIVDSESKGAISSFTFTNVIADHTIAASFVSSPQFIITASAGSGGSISPHGEVTVSNGNDQTFIITPNQGYNIQGVIVDSESKSAISSFTFTNVEADHTIVASFAQLPVAAFKSYNIEDVGGSETRVEGYHSVGGLLEFDASGSYDPSGGKLTYYWDFGDGSQAITSDPKYQKIYTKPEKFTVNLNVKNVLGQESEIASEDLDLSLEPGDLLIIRSGYPYAQIFDLGGLTYTHIGMYVGKINEEYLVVESAAGEPPLSNTIGVQETNIKRWAYSHESYADIVTIDTDSETKARAVAFARGLALDPNKHLYDFGLTEKQVDCTHTGEDNSCNCGIDGKDCPSNVCGCNNYYCSELVWAAYYEASDGAINLGNNPAHPFKVAVSPDDILNHPLATVKSWHHEKYPPKSFGLNLIITVKCPVDISVTDPSGLSITKLSSDINDAIYFESDLNDDNDADDGIVISKPIKGDYLITVVPEADALPTDIFTLTITVNGKSTVLAQDVRIKDIPSTPYIYPYESENQVPVPEFPSKLLPATMIIGFLGAVLLIQSTREH